MFDVSDKYIEASHAATRETELRGKLILTNGSVMSFTSKDLLQGSTSYSNRCLSNETFNLGACYIGEFKTTLKTRLNRYAIYGGTISVEFVLKVDSGEWEVIPIGEFTIKSAVRVGGYVQIDSFDNMHLLDKNVSQGTSGTPSELLSWMCQQCGCSSGMTDEMWAELVNTDFVFAFSESDYSSYRDLLSDLATLVGGFATADRYGAIVIKPMHTTIKDTVDDTIRSQSKFEDNVCQYTSVSMKVKGVQYGYTYEDNYGSHIALYDNKLAGANTPDQINTILKNIVDNMLCYIQYIPSEVTMLVNPAYDLGDFIKFEGYNVEGTMITQLHSISWTFRSSMTIIGIGENEIANAKSATDKLAESAGTASADTEIKTMEFTNAKAITIQGSKRAQILDATFSATYSDTAVTMLTGQCIVNIEEPATYRIVYELNGKEADFKPEEAVYNTGSKVFTFIKAFSDLSVDVSNRLKIYLECDPLTITSKQLTKDSSGEYSLTDVEITYNGKASIDVGKVSVILQAANLSFAIKWDGNFEISEVFEQPMAIDRFSLIPPSDIATFTIVESKKLSIKESTSLVYRLNSMHDIQEVSGIIMDYDAVPVYDLQFTELSNGTTKSGTISNSTVIMLPNSDIAGCCVPFYMQLPAGQGTKITLETDTGAKLYLLENLSDNWYSTAIGSEDGVIEYTSTGARFWLLILSTSRHDQGTYTIKTEII